MSKQPVGPVSPSGAASTPTQTPLDGRYTSLIRLEPSHAEASWKHLGGERNGHLWTYMLGGPYTDHQQWKETVEGFSKLKDPLFYTVLSGPRDDPTSEPVGQISYFNIVPDHRRIEIGNIIFGKPLQQTKAATEAFYLIIKHAFDDLGYLRVEWKANHLNKPSLAAAERLGFVFEGIFRKHMIIKGRRRDTAWLSITDEDWPVVKKAFETWLSEENFDKDGKQIKSLKDVRRGFAESS